MSLYKKTKHSLYPLTFLLSALLLSPVTLADDDDKSHATIKEVHTSYADNSGICSLGVDTLSIFGDGFDHKSNDNLPLSDQLSVSLGEQGVLTLCSASANEIIVECPSGVCPTGDFNLEVSYGKDLKYSVQHDMTLGAQGLQGEVGETGEMGIQGEIGAQGPAGNDGAQGPAGNDGAQGPAGNDGALGPAGNDGAQGPAGNDGAQGPAGNDGAQGPAGNDGAQGPAGNDGAQGPAGNDGAQGPAGNDGAQGPAGNDGAQGPAGNDGALGPAGNDGALGPAGDDGAQGPAGNDGAQGPAGNDGAQGPAGNDGAQGPAGNDGAQGPAGNDGAQGSAGNDGAQGPAGNDGTFDAPDTTDAIFGSGPITHYESASWILETPSPNTLTLRQTGPGFYNMNMVYPNNCTGSATTLAGSDIASVNRFSTNVGNTLSATFCSEGSTIFVTISDSLHNQVGYLRCWRYAGNANSCQRILPSD